jgi:diguanylate cyclase (GGDEF)-like protein
VARLLREQVRANDVLAQESVGERRELHARFGGDEFCFLIPQLDSPQDAWVIAERFREAVERFDWTIEDERLAARHVAVDVGVVCLLLGPVETRRTVAGQLAQDLLACADRAMYTAKADRVPRVHGVTVQITGGTLTPIDLP